jgi:hypothetical protein
METDWLASRPHLVELELSLDSKRRLPNSIVTGLRNTRSQRSQFA